MDISEIVERARKLSSLTSLLLLLNDLKKDEFGIHTPLFTINTLKYFSNPDCVHGRYKSFCIPKKNGKSRKIYAPNYDLKLIQHFTNIILTAIHQPHDSSFGFVPQRSICGNAAVHVDKNYVYNLDLSDFFTTIPAFRVWKRLQYPPFCFNTNVAKIFAGICSIKLYPSRRTQVSKITFCVPQGAPTSPTIANAICDVLDKRLYGVAKRFGLHYSRYADDLTFSSNYNVYQEHSEFINELHRIIRDQGFSINPDKTRLQKKGSRQIVTGLVVCEKVNVKREYVRSLRQLLYIWSKYGFQQAERSFLEYHKKNSIRVKRKTTPNLINYIDGNLQFLKMVKGESDSQYLKLRKDFDNLIKLRNREIKVSPNLLEFISTEPLLDYENKRNEIHFSTTHKTSAYFLKGRKPLFLSVAKNLESRNKNDLFVSKCKRINGSIVYLIHDKNYKCHG